MEELLTTAEVAALVRMSEEWVRDHAGELGGIRLGRTARAQLRFRPALVDAYLEQREIAPPASQAVRKPPGPRRATSGVPLLPLPR